MNDSKLVVTGRTAEAIWLNIRGAEWLLSDSRRFKRLRVGSPERYEMELRLSTFIKSILYGYEADTFAENYGDRYGYAEAFESIHGPKRGFTRLLPSTRPIVMELRLKARYRERVMAFDLGHAEGITTVIPFTKDGFEKVKAGEVSLANILPNNTYAIRPPQDDPQPKPSFLFIATSFHMPALGHFFGNLEEVGWDGGDAGQRLGFGLRLMRQLMRHIAEFCPSLRCDEERKLVEYTGSEQGDRLPEFYCMPVRSLVERMLIRAGFECGGTQEIAGRMHGIPSELKMYFLKFDDLNKTGKSETFQILKGLFKISRP